MKEGARRFLPNPDTTETQQPAGIRALYDPSLLSPDCPYTVTFAAEQTADLLRTFDVDDKHIQRIQIAIRRSPIVTPDGKTGGAYRNNHILLTADDYWKIYREGLERLFAEATIRPNDGSIGLLEYIHAFADKVVKHELGHAISDFYQKRDILRAASSFRLGEAFSLLMQRPLLTPDDIAKDENAANEIVHQINASGNWMNFLQITPKHEPEYYLNA